MPLINTSHGAQTVIYVSLACDGRENEQAQVMSAKC